MTAAAIEPLGSGAPAIDPDIAAGVRCFDRGVPTDVIDTSLLTGGEECAGLGPTELRAGDPARPHPLATTAPGPELASLLDIYDTATLTDAGLVAFVAACERQKAWLDAHAVAATVELTARCARLRGVGNGADEVPAEQVAATELSAGLALSPVAARNRVELAAGLRRLPRTRIQLAAGHIDLARARTIVDEVAVLDDGAAAEVEQRVLTQASGRTLPWLRAALRRAVIAVDPTAAQTRRELATIARGVAVERLADGMGRLEWVAPAEQVMSGYHWVTALGMKAQAADRARARAQRASGVEPDPVRSLDACRSDALGELAMHALRDDGSLPHRHGRPPQIGVVLAASTLLGLDDEPGELTGFGPIPAQVARLLATDGVWRRLLTDPAGRLSDVSVDSYQPTQAMRDFVLARDSVCQGPGCRMPAERCDLDHTLEWPCGPTCPGNLCPLCRRDHRLKTLTDATVEPDGAGGLVWTLPSGRRYHRRAEPLLDHPGLTTEPVGAGLLDLYGGPPGGTDPPAPPPEDDVPPF